MSSYNVNGYTNNNYFITNYEYKLKYAIGCIFVNKILAIPGIF
ncbi:hypothetical protein UNH65_26330 [Chitinophaga sp. 180180018-2]